jgi:hypothetical protein
MRATQPGSNFLELKNHFFAFFGVKILKFFDEDPGWKQFGSGIRDGKKSNPGSGINIPDPQHCKNVHLFPVLWIRDVYPGSEFFFKSRIRTIPDFLPEKLFLNSEI